MKILFLGSYSGLFTDLQTGLKELGHESSIVVIGDNWQKQNADLTFRNSSNVLHKIIKPIQEYLFCSSLQKYDRIILQSPFLFSRRFGLNETLINKILSYHPHCYLSAAGTDAYSWKCYQSLKYNPYHDLIDNNSDHTFYSSLKSYEWNKSLANRVKGIIPIAYTYAEAYKKLPNLQASIPIPINLSNYKYSPITANNKIIVFHGITRQGFKGTKYIKKAFELVSKLYPNDFEFILKGNMTINEYKKIMEKSHLIVDQCNSYGYGVNGVIALAMGKILLSGAEPEFLKDLNVTDCPVYNIIPCVDQIVKTLVNLLNQKKSFNDLGLKSRDYVNNVHDHLKITHKYIKALSL
ncbi:MAG: hypothetical protein COB02_03715 [Candidatus Cloacimonadota bacterium]|nr:MAG: hypothetical protein COB02_03715 [Candidatus Cloacimonadota bacterium]